MVPATSGYKEGILLKMLLTGAPFLIFSNLCLHLLKISTMDEDMVPDTTGYKRRHNSNDVIEGCTFSNI